LKRLLTHLDICSKLARGPEKPTKTIKIYFNFKFYNQIFESGSVQEGAVRV